MPKIQTTGKLKSPLIKMGPKKAKAGPVWDGPESDSPNGGITFSALSRFLTCRERFRVQMIEGWRPADAWNAKIEFGQMWHVCEEALAVAQNTPLAGSADSEVWSEPLVRYVQDLLVKYPLEREQIVHWYHVCVMQVPLYVEHWKRHADVTARTPLLQEQTFNVPYKLPSGRVVRLRGKWDAVDLIGTGKAAGVYLQENKTKQRIDETKIKRMLTCDLQTMLYLVALSESDRQVAVPVDEKTRKTSGLPKEREAGSREKMGARTFLTHPVAGVRYNVIRRSEHRVGKKETPAEFIERLRGIILEKPDEWFMRWRVEVSPADVQRFRRECLDPILEQVCEWYEAMKFAGPDPFSEHYNCHDNNGLHFRMPFGADNTVSEYGWGDLDEYITSGSTVGLKKVETLFGELQ